MGETTGISWCHHTFNVWWGCVEVSEACDFCYARTFDKRVGGAHWGHGEPRRFFPPAHYLEPLKWNRKAEQAGVRRRVFCGSMMDIGERHPVKAVARAMGQYRRQLFTEIIPATPWLDWLLLTKRPWSLVELVPEAWQVDGWPQHVWPGTTAETQHWYDVRVAALVKAPAATRFISYEPALGPIDFRLAQTPIAWVIAGGESGAHFRAADETWYRSARDQCVEAGVSYWFKQHAGIHPKLLGDRLDGRQWHDVPDRLS